MQSANGLTALTILSLSKDCKLQIYKKALIEEQKR